MSFIHSFIPTLCILIFRLLRNEIGQSLRKDREARWSERANELEAAAASGKYADDIVLLCDNAQATQSALNQLEINVRTYGMCFASSKCKVLLQDWQDPDPALTLDGEKIEVVEKFVYLVSCISAAGGVSDEINSRVKKARADYANLGHLWRLRDVSLAVKVRIYSASVGAVLLYACETWPL
ncbi:unnamed protein product [Schistosoma mattheei]|uniref:Uncharacterized protein n=1 Tax=Schistosoma mattheei TaxID=31246 RepID=A0A183Q8Q5_9TREM|nr:unnamed protein product [Schistosoma mattheei]